MTEFIDAGGALGRAARMESESRRRSGWYVRYLWVYAAGQLVLVPTALLWRSLAGALVFTTANLLLVGGLSVYAARQHVVTRRFGVRHGTILALWAAAFGLAVAVGLSVFRDSVAYALIAAVWCALPPALGALRERRRTS
jgi:hypothetical protein